MLRRALPLIVLCCAAFAVGGTGCSPGDDGFERLLAQSDQFDLLISNGTVVDGSGSAPRTADVLVSGDEIVYVGEVDQSRLSVASVVDATGRFVVPGFVDPHSHGNPLRTPEMANFVAMGVTTITLGQDGSSPGVFDVSRWMDAVDSVGPAVNIALFAGHGTLRRLSGIGNDTDPGREAIDSLRSLLLMQLDAGALGLSTGLEYTPGAYAGEEELLAVASAAGERDAVVMSHIRNEDDDAVEGAIRELLRLAEVAPVHVSHIKSVYGQGAERAEEILAVLDSARSTGARVTADMYPYTASYTGIGIVFPLWAKGGSDYEAVARTRRDDLADYLRRRVTLRNGPEATLIGTGKYAGMTLAEVADQLEKPFEDVLIDDFGPGGASGAYFVMDEELQTRFAQDPNVMFSSDGSLTGFHPRGHGTFARIIADYVRDKKLLSLEEAVRKMTSLPASTVGLADRGLIAPGYKADIAVFDLDSVNATATYAAPHQLAEGFDDVLVDGVFVRRGGEFTEARPGRVIRSGR